jgi:hypothetical protein
MGGVTLIVVAGALYLFSSSDESSTSPTEARKEAIVTEESKDEV